MTFRVFRAFAPLTILAACVDVTGVQDMLGGGRLLSIGVAGGVVEVGDTVRLTATGKPSGIIGMFTYDRLLDARWSVSDPSIAQIQPLPPPLPDDSVSPTRTLVRGLRLGSTSVIAAARGVKGQAMVRVIPVLRTVQVRATRDTVAVGDTISVTAVAIDFTGAPVDGLRITFAVVGGVQLYSWSDSTARVVAAAVGSAAVSAGFRRASGEARLIVVPRAP